MKINHLFLFLLFLTLPATSYAQKGPLWIYTIDHYRQFAPKLEILLLNEAPAAKELILVLCDLYKTRLSIKNIQAYYCDDHRRNCTSAGRVSPGPIQLNYFPNKTGEKKLLRSNSEYFELRARESKRIKEQHNHRLWPQVRSAVDAVKKTKKYAELRQWYGLDGLYGAPGLEFTLLTYSE